MKPFFVALFLVLPLSVRAEQLVRIAAEDIVSRLHDQGVPVCFERVHNQKGDAITLKKQIDNIQAIPENERTPRESERLKYCLKNKSEGMTEDMVLNWRQNTFDFTYPNSQSTPDEILSMLVQIDTDYQWEKAGRRYLVYPKNGSFNCQIPAFSIVNASFDDFIKAGIDHITRPAKLNYIFAGVGRPWILDYKDKKFSLALDSTDARSALTSFCDAIGPHVVWHVLGCDPDWVNVGFSPVYPQK